MWSPEQEARWDREERRKQVIESGGAADRYTARIGLFERDGRPRPRLRHAALWLLHNCVAHPLLAVAPGIVTRDLHDLSSDWLNHQFSNGATAPVPKPGDRAWWFLHNAVAHPLIGVLPSKWTFAFHDESARRMKTRGWV